MMPSALERKLGEQFGRLINDHGYYAGLLKNEMADFIALFAKAYRDEGASMGRIDSSLGKTRDIVEVVSQALVAQRVPNPSEVLRQKSVSRWVVELRRLDVIDDLEEVRLGFLTHYGNIAKHTAKRGRVTLNDYLSLAAILVQVIDLFFDKIPVGAMPPPRPIVIFGSALGNAHLRRIYDLAADTFPGYVEDAFEGAIHRFEANPEIFHGVFDEISGECYGFLLIVPLTRDEFERTIVPGIRNIDEEIEDKEILPFSSLAGGVYSLHFSSVVSRQGKAQRQTDTLLVDHFYHFLTQLAVDREIQIGDISAEAVTGVGKRLCEERLRMNPVHHRPDGSVIYRGTMKAALMARADWLWRLHPRLAKAYGLNETSAHKMA